MYMLKSKKVDRKLDWNTEINTSEAVSSFWNWCKMHPLNMQWVLFSMLILLLSIFVFCIFHDFTRISWKDGNDILYVKKTTVVLEVEAAGAGGTKLENISFVVSEGRIKTDGCQVTWTLPYRNGTYEIIASTSSGKKIKKQVILSMNDSELAGLIELESAIDTDYDGISDLEEEKYQTNPKRKDSDGDGLSDYTEIFITKTNPLVKDSDGDGLEDGVEMDLGLDPNQQISKNDSIIDSERILEYQKKQNGVQVSVVGSGNITKMTIDSFSYFLHAKMIPVVYQIELAGDLESNTMAFSYTADVLSRYQIMESKLQVYFYDMINGTIQPLNTIMDTQNHLLTIQNQKSGYYVIGEKDVQLPVSNILFLIDQTTSLYSKAEFDSVGRICIGCKGNDTELKRFDYSAALVNQLSGSYQYAVSIFAKGYIESLDWTESKSQAKSRLEYLKFRSPDFQEEVDFENVLKNALNQFSYQREDQYIVLVTDSKDTVGNLENNMAEIIQTAQLKNVHFLIVALGKDVDSNFQQLATMTLGQYFYSSSSASLEDTFLELTTYLNHRLISIYSQEEGAQLVLADSGFYTTKNGFSFSNYASVKSEAGNCYGMALFASLYYQDKLPLILDSIDYSLPDENGKYGSPGYNLNNTYFETEQLLYDYKIKDSRLQLYFHSPQDLYEFHDDVLYLRQDYYQQLKSIGMTSNIKTVVQNSQVKQYQEMLLNVDHLLFQKNISKEEQELFQAIWRLHLNQMKDQRKPFMSNPDIRYEELKSALEAKNPVVLGIDGNHAVNAIRLLKDIEDPNIYFIEVYDNNLSGQKSYIKVVRNLFSDYQKKQADWITTYDYQFYYREKEITLDLIFNY